MDEIELLAPVGSWDALVAAVQNGADAVYLGGKVFSARQYANNFDDEELKRAVSYCHIRGVKIFITVNTLVSNGELMELGKYLTFLYNIDVDAIIVQDLGVAKFVRELLPDFEIHASTQMSVHNLEGVKLLEEIGFKRVVLAREMSREEICWVQKNTELDIEVFVHGALCVCYSGQCLMSSMIGGRSGNRGRCAQPCRRTYSLVDLRNGKEIKSELGDYLLSPRDLNTLENIDTILDTGIKSLKIEGRMKRPEYVATVIGAYRMAIDQHVDDGGRTKIDKTTLREVEQVFNRGFTKGYILGEKGKSMMSISKPNNRGIQVGQVVDYNKKKRKVRIQLNESLSKGDGIEIWTGGEENVGTIVEWIYVGGEKRECGNPGDLIEINFKHFVHKDYPVYKTSDVRLLKRAKETYERVEMSIGLYGQFIGNLDNPIELSLWDDDGNHVHQKGEYVVEKALKTSMSKERIYAQISKVGNTPYKMGEIDIQLDEGVAIPIGALNQLRRGAIEKLGKLRENHNHREWIDINTFQNDIKDWFEFEGMKRDKKISIRVTVQNMKQLKALSGFSIDRIYYGDMDTFDKALEIAKGMNSELVPFFSRITEDEELVRIKEKIEAFDSLEGVMVSNLGILHLLDKKKYSLYGDFSLNVFNNGAIKFLEERNVDEITLSPELTLKEMKNIIKRASIPCEAIIHGSLPLMVSKYCPVNTLLQKDQEKNGCSICKNNQFGLKDRLGVTFPIMTKDCRVEILNGQKLCLIEYIDELLGAGIHNLRIQFTLEEEREIINTLKAYEETIKNSLEKSSSKSVLTENFIKKMKEEGLTKGHFFRGVM